MNASNARSTVTLALALVFTITGGRVLAGDTPDASARASSGVYVRYNDLDLSKPDDVAVLYKRISRAANDICGSASSFDGRVSVVEKCREQTIQAAVARIDKPQLTAFVAK